MGPEPTLRKLSGTALAVGVLAVAGGACRSGATETTGTLELRLVLPTSGLAGLGSVTLAPEWAGAGAGPRRDAGWARVPVQVPEVTVRAGEQSAPVAVARGEIPAGRYDRVHVAVPRIVGRSGGRTVAVTSHIEPIARGFELTPGGHVAVDIEIVILPRSPASGGGLQAFVRDARLAETTTGVGGSAMAGPPAILERSTFDGRPLDRPPNKRSIRLDERGHDAPGRAGLLRQLRHRRR